MIRKYWARWGLLLTVVLLLNSTAWAKMDEITVRDFSLQQSEVETGVLVATIQFDYQLSDYLRESLLSGITLRNEIRFDLVWHKEWWFNKTETLASIITELKYHALSRHYQLVRKDTGENWNFTSLAAALEHLGKVRQFSLPTLPTDAYYNNAAIYVEAVLEPETSNLPLNLASVFSNKNRLVSQGVLWPVTP